MFKPVFKPKEHEVVTIVFFTGIFMFKFLMFYADIVDPPLIPGDRIRVETHGDEVLTIVKLRDSFGSLDCKLEDGSIEFVDYGVRRWRVDD